MNKNAFSRFFAIGYFLLGCFILIGTAPNLGVIKAMNLTLYANLYSGIISSFMLLMLLRDRQHQKNLVSNAAIESERVAQLALKVEKERRELQGKLMSMLTHELRTPLYLLRLVIESMSPNNKQVLQAGEAIKDMYMIVERCQQMDRFDGVSKDALQIADINPVPIIHELLSQRFMSGKWVCNVSNTQPLRSDEAMFKIIIANLIENAVKYSAAGSDISLSVSTKSIKGANYWRFLISNQVGKAGVPDANRLFDKYYRSPRAHNLSGSGLGLYLVKSLTELLGGVVTHSVVGDQIGFEICLPQ